jgi:hypothetical protein
MVNMPYVLLRAGKFGHIHSSHSLFGFVLLHDGGSPP